MRVSGSEARTDRRSLLILLIVGASLRFYRLGDDSVWYNEILSERRATVPLGYPMRRSPPWS